MKSEENNIEYIFHKNTPFTFISLILPYLSLQNHSNHKWSSKPLELLKNLKKASMENILALGKLDNVKIQNRKLLTLTSVCSHIFS